MIQKKKCPEASIMTEIVLPNDTNVSGNLMGGKLLYWMDIISAIAAIRHCNQRVVTASADNVSFAQEIKLGDIVTLKAQVTRAFRTSMEVLIKVLAEDALSHKRFQSNTAFFTLVAIGVGEKPVEVPELVPNTVEEKELFQGALYRRQLRLVLAKKMRPGEATALKSLFL